MQKKIYEKREFYIHRVTPHLKPLTAEEINEYRLNVCGRAPKIQSHQAFVARFIHPETPYRGILIMHGTGSGKTFASVSICENFKRQVAIYGTKMFILVPGPILKKQFSDDLVTICTNYAYMPPELAARYPRLSHEEKRQARYVAFQAARKYYEIISYKSFHRRVLGEKIGDKRVQSMNHIEHLNNTVIIVDEAHSFTNNEYGEALRHIQSKSTNLRTILLTATPMKNVAEDIVDLLNFIRPLQDPIDKARVFQQENNLVVLKKSGREYLQRMATGYVSFYRGANPYTFAKKKDMGVVPDGLLYTPLIRCQMMDFQYKPYLRVVADANDSLDKKSQSVSNFVFPVIDLKNPDKLVGVSGEAGLRMLLQQLHDSPKILREAIQRTLCPDEKDLGSIVQISRLYQRPSGKIFMMPHLRHFSAKFAECFTRLSQLEGTAFVYSNLVRVGANLFQEVMLANGFLEFKPRGDYTLLSNTRHYMYPVTYEEYDATKYGPFKPATFMAIVGTSEGGVSNEIPAEKVDVIQRVFNSPENSKGEMLKVIVGSRVVNEGVTFENVKQVHLLDVHYHLGRVDQVIGRAIRQCRHMKVTTSENPFPEVEVYRYVVAHPHEPNKLSREEEMYQRAELKFITVKQIERILIESAIDCPLNHAANQIAEDIVRYKNCKTVEEVLQDPSLKKAMCPARCEFMDCRFRCGSHTLNMSHYDRTRNIYTQINKSHLDFSTFSRSMAQQEIDFCKLAIKDMFRIRNEYTYLELEELVKGYYPEDKRYLFDPFFLMRALTDLMPIGLSETINFRDYVIDKYNVSGYLVYTDSKYTFKSQGYINQSDEMIPSTEERILLQPEGNSRRRASKFDEQYYAAKKENWIVGIMDGDTFRMRPARVSDGAKKRLKGLPTTNGSVCSFSRSLPELINVLKRVGGSVGDRPTKQSVCAAIRNRLVELEKHDNKGITYMVIPKDHGVYPFPLNITDRIKEVKLRFPKVTKVEKNRVKVKSSSLTRDDADFLKRLGFKRDGREWRAIFD